MLGISTSEVEVSVATKNGFWLLLSNEEFFLPFQEFPWFKNATVEQLLEVERLSENHLYWPMLDVDLAVDSIRHPEQFPLIAR